MMLYEKLPAGHILNKIIVIWFLKPAPFVIRSWSRDQTVAFKFINYLFLNTNFALKLQRIGHVTSWCKWPIGHLFMDLVLRTFRDCLPIISPKILCRF